MEYDWRQPIKGLDLIQETIFLYNQRPRSLTHDKIKEHTGVSSGWLDFLLRLQDDQEIGYKKLRAVNQYLRENVDLVSNK